MTLGFQVLGREEREGSGNVTLYADLNHVHGSCMMAFRRV